MTTQALKNAVADVLMQIAAALRKPKRDPLNGFPTEDEAYRGVLK